MLSSLAPCQIGVTGHNVKWIDRRSHPTSYCPALYSKEWLVKKVTKVYSSSKNKIVFSHAFYLFLRLMKSPAMKAPQFCERFFCSLQKNDYLETVITWAT